MSTLDEIRASIVARFVAAQDRTNLAMNERDCAEAELEAHDRAVAAMGAPAAPPPRAPRRDLAELVRGALTDEPQTIGQLADKTICPPSRVRLVLERLGDQVINQGVWYRRRVEAA